MAGYRSQLDVAVKARGETRLQAQRQRLRGAGLLPLGAESGGASSGSASGQALQIRLRGSFACRSNRLLFSAGCWAVGPGCLPSGHSCLPVSNGCLPNSLPGSNGRGLGGWQGLA